MCRVECRLFSVRRGDQWQRLCRRHRLSDMAHHRILLSHFRGKYIFLRILAALLYSDAGTVPMSVTALFPTDLLKTEKVIFSLLTRKINWAVCQICFCRVVVAHQVVKLFFCVYSCTRCATPKKLSHCHIPVARLAFLRWREIFS